MAWQDFIASDPLVLGGKPVVRGTRLSVDFLLGLFAAGWTQEEVLANYPSLTPESLRAVFAYAAEAVRDDQGLPATREPGAPVPSRSRDLPEHVLQTRDQGGSRGTVESIQVLLSPPHRGQTIDIVQPQ